MQQKTPDMPKPKLVACPSCKTLVAYSRENPFRPFCSERCKMIDLGDWANEQFRIPEQRPANEPGDE